MRAGLIAPNCCHDAATNPSSPSSVGATQLLKSSASGAPRHTTGIAIATNATAATTKITRPENSGSGPTFPTGTGFAEFVSIRLSL